MNVRAMVAKVCDELLTTSTTGTSPVEVELEIFRRYPALADEYGEQLAHIAIRKVAREELRTVGNDSQMQFPGFDSVPGRFTVPDGEGGYRSIGLAHAQIRHITLDNAVKDENTARCVAEAEAGKAFERRLRSVAGAHDGMAVIDALRLAGNGG